MKANEYHQLTSYQRNRMPRHFLDWQNRPSTFKTYPDADLIQLPTDLHFGKEKFSNVLSASYLNEDKGVPDINTLSKILSLAYTITAKEAQGGGYFYYRSVASAGALYPVEIYVTTRDIAGLKDGLYHFSIADHAVAALRHENIAGFVAGSLTNSPACMPSLIFFFTAIFFRSAWKYRDRAYRYHLLDTGHLIENVALAIKAEGFLFDLSYDFDDQALNRLLGLDAAKEACLALCSIPGTELFAEDDKGEKTGEPGAAVIAAGQVAIREIQYPAIQKIHEASMTGDINPEEAISGNWPMEPTENIGIKIASTDDWPEEANFCDAFLQRRSHRNFIPQSLPYNHLRALMECLCISKLPELSDQGQQPDIGVIIERAEGLDPGLYLLDRYNGFLQMVKRALLADQMAHICLGQKWLSHASVHVLFSADLEKIDSSCGARGYRRVMMNSGRLGERLYLAATAMGLGCCGIGAFYDGEAAELLELKRGSRLLYLIALGPVNLGTQHLL